MERRISRRRALHGAGGLVADPTLDDAGVNGKARGLIEPVLGVAQTDALIRRVNTLDELGDVRELRALLVLAR